MTQENLVKKLCQKDEKAFIYVMDKYSRLLWRIAEGILKNVCSAEDIEECIADVYFKLWQNPHAFDSEKASLKNYLAMMTKSRAIDIYRKKAKLSECELDENAVDSESDPVSTVISQENREELNRALDRLSVSDKEIVERRYLLNEKPSEISERMALPVRNIENRLYRAKQSLKKLLSSEKY